MYYKKIENAFAAYVSSDGARYELMSADAVHPRFVKEWRWFETLDDCLAAWSLIYDPLPEPEPEN